jgi:hypothetical protein
MLIKMKKWAAQFLRGPSRAGNVTAKGTQLRRAGTLWGMAIEHVSKNAGYDDAH